MPSTDERIQRRRGRRRGRDAARASSVSRADHDADTEKIAAPHGSDADALDAESAAHTVASTDPFVLNFSNPAYIPAVEPAASRSLWILVSDVEAALLNRTLP